MTFIDDPRKWRLSMDGFTIKTGWADEKKYIARFPQLPGQSLNNKAFEEWVENACKICDLYNADLKRRDADGLGIVEDAEALAVRKIIEDETKGAPKALKDFYSES